MKARFIKLFFCLYLLAGALGMKLYSSVHHPAVEKETLLDGSGLSE